MAKLGEGDPRWIVNERSDGKNVNSWHWEERDMGEWGRGRLKTILKDAEVTTQPWESFKVTKVVSVTGDATLAQRKGKKMSFFDFNIKYDWEGTANINSKSVFCKGEIHCESASQDDMDDIDVEVTVKEAGKEEGSARQLAKSAGKELLQSSLQAFYAELQSHHRDATPIEEAAAAAEVAMKNAAIAAAQKPSAPTVAPATQGKRKIACESFNQKVGLRTSPSSLYELLLDPSRMSAISQAQATISPVEKSSFSLFGGSVTGKIITLEPGKKIMQEWRMADWPAGHHSTVTINLLPHDNGQSVNVELQQRDVPADEVKRTQQGWRERYWERMQMMFGFAMVWGGFKDEDD